MNNVDENIVFETAKFLLDNNCDSEGFKYIWKDILERMKKIESGRSFLIDVVDYELRDAKTGEVFMKGTKAI